MTTQPPFLIRVTAGLVAAGVDQLRQLPEQLPGLSVTAAGKGMRAWMRLQQELAGLAARGDEVLASWSSPPEEAPWATFDEDMDADFDHAPDTDLATDADVTTIDDVSPGPADSRDTAGSADDDSAEEPTGPAEMPEYADLSLAQVRARMVPLAADAVARLLDYEERTAGRASFLTLLGNRVAKLRTERDGGA